MSDREAQPVPPPPLDPRETSARNGGDAGDLSWQPGAPPGYPPYSPYSPYAPYPPPPPAPSPAPYYAGPMPPSTSGWAIASLACSILGIVGFPVLGSILGVIFGHIALGEIARAQGRLEGRGMAVAGLVIGYATIALGLLVALVVIIAMLASASANTLASALA